MLDPQHALFNEQTIKKLCSTVAISPKQQESAQAWLELLKSGSLNAETSNYIRFALYVLQDILGYPVRQDLNFEQGNVEFSFRNQSGIKGVCIEVKGLSTKDLFSSQHREKPEHQTPIKQTWDYMGNGDFEYGISTNYNTFVLIDRSKGYSKYHIFNFMDIENNDSKLKEFVAIFSRQSIIENSFISKLYHESIIQEHEFTKQFYKLYHETRLMLIKEFNNNGVANLESIHYAQLFLNRLIFLFFAEDTDKIKRRLFADSVLQSLNPLLISEYSRYVSDTITSLFDRLDKGSKFPLEIFGFNGGLFHKKIPSNVFFNDMRSHTFFEDVKQYSTLKNKIDLDEYSRGILKQFNNTLNPLIANLLLMSSFNFKSEVNVNILGHIFEQSITDLEELKDPYRFSKRKKEGIFYTPEFITDYICRNAIIPYLSLNGANNVKDLVEEHSNNITALEQKFRDIKILDLACGSGAFLIKAIDILLDIHKEIQFVKENEGIYTSTRKKGQSQVKEYTLVKWKDEEEAKQIIERNIFGVDINEESVEITKLSLFLKIASNENKLIDLNRNIKQGNSLISDTAVDSKAFDWKTEFPEIYDRGGFDIVIGNPPYVRMEKFKDIKSGLRIYETHAERSDLYVYFYERGFKLLRNNGRLAFISSNTFLRTGYGLKLRTFLQKHSEIQRLLNLGETQFFEDATTYPLILFIRKPESINPSHKIEYIETRNLEPHQFDRIVSSGWNMVPQMTLKPEMWIFEDKSNEPIIRKLQSNTKLLKDYCGSPLMGIKTGLNEAFIIDSSQRDKLLEDASENNDLIKPFLMGKDLRRWHTPSANKYLIYPHIVKNIDKYDHIKRYLEGFKEKLENRATQQNWWELQQPQEKYIPLMNGKKIVYVDIADKPTFSLDENGFYLANSVYFLPSSDKYLLCLLNSSLCKWFIFFTSRPYRGGYVTFRNIYIERIPVKVISELERENFSQLADEMIFLTKSFETNKEKFINRVLTHFAFKTRSKKLEQFWKIGFDAFVAEIKRNSSISFDLKKQDEWEEYFNEYKPKLQQLEANISNLESRIDGKIFDVYELTENERKTIYENLKLI
jgi:hypothetical protein